MGESIDRVQKINSKDQKNCEGMLQKRLFCGRSKALRIQCDSWFTICQVALTLACRDFE